MNTVTSIFKTLKTLHCGGGVSFKFGSKGNTVMQGIHFCINLFLQSFASNEVVLFT